MFGKRMLKIVSCLVLAALLCAFIPATAVFAYTDPSLWDGTYPSYNASAQFSPATEGGTDYGNGSSSTPYIIATAQDLAQLCVNVNNSTNDNYTGKYFKMIVNINLQSYAWTPIGGHCSLSSGVPTGKYFSGVFDGNNNTISNISITSATNAYGGYGLFGYINGGTVGNLNTSGTISLSTYTVSAVGGIAGYLYGSLYNCHSAVTITAASASYVGGIAGIAERVYSGTRPAVNYIKYCSNSGVITGGTRTGGILGEAYCHYHATNDNGGIVVDQCCNTGSVTCSATSKTYAGGIVGYNTGYITNCYNQGNLTGAGSSVKVYLGGITGINTAESSSYDCALSRMENCYSTAVFANFMTGYAKYAWASADSSTTVIINNTFWLATTTNVTQPTSGYGTCTNCQEVTTNQLKGITKISGSNDILYYLGSDFAFKSGTDYPILTWQDDSTFKVTNLGSTSPSGSGTDTDVTTAVFLDGTAATNGSGTKASPCNNFSSAKTALSSATTKTIYITGMVTVSDSQDWDLYGISGAKVTRSCGYTDYLVEVVSNGDLNLDNITIDGNTANLDIACSSPLCVNGGTLTFCSNAVLQNNFVNGGAIRVISGTVDMTGGSIIDNTARNYGGAVMVMSENSTSYGTFNMSGGIIGGSGNGNTGYYGGAVGVIDYGVFNMTGGTISYNTATYGGGLYADGACSMTSGTISNNTATYGGGVCIDSGTLDMSDGAITSNTANSLGGGVYDPNSGFTYSDINDIYSNSPDDIYPAP